VVLHFVVRGSRGRRNWALRAAALNVAYSRQQQKDGMVVPARARLVTFCAACLLCFHTAHYRHFSGIPLSTLLSVHFVCKYLWCHGNALGILRQNVIRLHLFAGGSSAYVLQYLHRHVDLLAVPGHGPVRTRHAGGAAYSER